MDCMHVLISHYKGCRQACMHVLSSIAMVACMSSYKKVLYAYKYRGIICNLLLMHYGGWKKRMNRYLTLTIQPAVKLEELWSDD